MQQQAGQTPRPWAPVIFMLIIFFTCLMAFAAVLGEGFVQTKSYTIPDERYQLPSDVGFSIYNKGLKELVDMVLGELPMLRAAQAFGILSLVALPPAAVSSMFDFRSGAVSVRTGALLFIPGVLLMITGVLEVVLYNTTVTIHWVVVGLSDVADLSWGFGLIVVSSLTAFVFGGVAMCLACCCQSTPAAGGYVQHPAQAYTPPQPNAVAVQQQPQQVVIQNVGAAE